MALDADPKWFDEVARRLRELNVKTKSIPLETLRAVFKEVFSHRPGSYKRRDLLLESLRHAEQKGAIRLPKKRGLWDHTGNPALPRRVTRVAEPSPPKDTWWKTYYWHPRLEWVADLPDLSEDRGAFLRRVQQALLDGRFNETTPLKRRSVELTGKEKRLGQLLKTPLFAPGRLSRDLLNVTSDVMPLAHEFVGGRPVALVFENKEPFNVALGVLRSLSNPPYGILAYGGGGSFEDSVRAFLSIQDSRRYRDYFSGPLERIEYVGDLDWAGLRMAWGARAKAQAHALPPVVPGAGLHKLMLDALSDPYIQHPDGFPDDEIKRARKPDTTLLAWLSEDVRDEVRRILELGHRVPEEMLSAAALRELWR